ncbi:Crp/Fnr family transcriptional regulator [Megalodesulfovibrio gigas]|uniref:Putative CarD family transcriptional regulator n=1 Tax=Megalodesulfovibrio gigas (strain ATCC 19364 / DSM 1382 / NCIMB 9332 / VKM B-1759) TaxID=1121448 RepID=T2GDH3_MEGG1|nr:Crp/Fnr family transcriptional regulator [Megalodesulfovibrio gigas]AGW14363.1 putative CarD family transcriptional regulator [Megalodesulfovibrio gigas DSM 1382 = ATCC 19364]
MPNDDALAFFESLPLFQGMPVDHLALLAHTATSRMHQTGELIVSQDAMVKGLYLLASGRVKLYKILPDGKEQTVYIFNPGEPFCLCSAFRGERFPANAEAMEPSRVYVIPGQALEDAARSDPSLFFNMLMILSRRLKEAMERIESLSTRDISRRVALYLSGHPGIEEGRLFLPMTHRELAKMLGATPEALSRAFRKLAEAGLLRLDGREVTILDAAGLERE